MALGFALALGLTAPAARAQMSGAHPSATSTTATATPAVSVPDTIFHTLDLSVARSERYQLEVSFPSAPGSRIVVGPNQNALLANLDPATIPNRTVVVYRDGRVILGGGPPLATPAAGAPRDPPALRLEPRFETSAAGFTIYYAGTVIPAWGDYDGDGDLDLPLFRNDGGTFSEIPGFRAMLADGNYHGSAWCDYDHDGDRDLVMLSYDTLPTRNLLLQNQGDGTFVDVAPSKGMDIAGRGETAVWGDFDNDGDPDLFAPYYSYLAPFRNFLYRNDGGGNFAEIADSAGVSMRDVLEEFKQEGAAAVDWDDDGDLDLYCASHLLINDGTGRFTDVHASVGLPERFDEGATLIDIDDDGDFDLYTRNVDTARLFRNDGGFFMDVTSTSGLDPAAFHWGDSWADADNDGDLDLLYFDNGSPSRLMLNRGDGTFVLDPGGTSSTAVSGMSAWADYDNDGDLDFVDGAQVFSMFVNHLERQPGFEGSFLRVEVVDSDSTENQSGATVRLRCLNGPTGVVRTRAVDVGAAYLSHNEYRTHLGLGMAGTVSRTPELAAYADGSEVTLAAAPAAGYHFAGWTGDAAGTTNPFTVVMNGSKGVLATFERDAYTVAVGATLGGGVTRAPEQATYPVGSRVVFTALPEPGRQFVGWSGDATGSDNPLTLIVDRDLNVAANFAVNTYTLSATSTGNGSVAKVPNQASYGIGAVVRLTATPSFGYHFDHWSGDAAGIANPLDFVVDGDRAVAASFAINTYALDVTVIGTGTVTKSPSLPSYPHGSQVGLTAQPGPDQRFAGWSGDATGSTSPVSLVMDRARSVTATFENIALYKWDGEGDGVSWADHANWAGPSLPDAAGEVLLDNTLFAGDYTVNLPSGGATIAVARLVIAPAEGRTITLILPSGNTANPGLFAGDNFAGTPDIRLASGAVLRNASGGTSGSRIQVDATNGIFMIENGARYSHATLSNPATLIARLSTAPGTERGEFEYDVPGISSYAIAASGVTYGSLTLSRATGSGSYTASGASALTVGGHLTIRSGGFSSTMSGDLNLSGDLINNGATLSLPASQRVVFEGDSAQHVSGGSSVQIGGPSTIAAGSTLALGSGPFTNNGVMSISGTLRFDDSVAPGGVGSYSYAATGKLEFGHPSGTFTIASTASYWPSGASPTRVEVKGPGGILLSAARTVSVSFTTGGPVSRADRLTLPGIARINPGGSLSRSPVYGPNATLIYGRGGSVGSEWIAGDLTGSGVPRHVTVEAGSGVVALPATGRTVPGDLTVSSGTLSFGTADLRVLGNVGVDGTLNANGSFLRFAGAGTQTVSGTGTLSLAGLALQKTTGSVRLARDLSAAPAAGNALEFAGALDRLELGSHRLALGGPIGGSDPNGVLAGGAAARLELSGSGSAGTLRFAPGTERLSTLSVDLAGGGDVVLASPLTVLDTLVLAQGRIETGAGALTIAAGGTVARTGGHVSGALRKNVATGASTVDFEVGSGGSYTPVRVDFGQVSTAGAVLVTSVDGDHPAIASSALRPAETVNRHWSLVNEGVDFDTCAATFTFVPSDLDVDATAESLVVREYQAGWWRFLEPGARTATSVEARGVTSLGDFAVGEATSWRLDLATSNNGTASLSPNQSAYDDGSEVEIAAVPDPGYRFMGWAGDTAASANPLFVHMLRDRALIAQFEFVAYALEITVTGPGMVLKTPDALTYPAGTVVNLVARPASGYAFGGWSGDTTATDTALVVIMSAVKNLTATFLTGTTLAAADAAEATEFELGPLAPNPSNSTVVISYALPEGAPVRLSVLDVQGRELAILARGDQSRGWHRVAWSGRTRNGKARPGLYFVRYHTPVKTWVRRLVIVP